MSRSLDPDLFARVGPRRKYPRWGIRPYDSNLHLWSHAHLFGSGLTRYVRQYKRVAMDRLVNRVRLDG